MDFNFLIEMFKIRKNSHYKEMQFCERFKDNLSKAELYGRYKEDTEILRLLEAYIYD